MYPRRYEKFIATKHFKGKTVPDQAAASEAFEGESLKTGLEIFGCVANREHLGHHKGERS